MAQAEFQVIPLGDFIREGVFNNQPPQSVCYFSPERFDSIRRRMNFGFEV